MLMMLGTVGQIVAALEPQEEVVLQPSRRDFVRTLPLLEERALAFPFVLLIQTLGLFLPVIQLFLTGMLMFFLGSKVYGLRGEAIDVILVLPLIFLAATVKMLVG